MRFLVVLLLATAAATGLGQPCTLPSFAPPVPIDAPAGIWTVDVDADGILDLLAGSTTGYFYLQGLGDGRFGPARPIPMRPSYPELRAVGDLNGDGAADLVVTRYATRSLSVLLGDGNGGFEEGPDVALGVATDRAVLLGDVDGDGRLDVVQEGTDPVDGSRAILTLLGDGRGAFPRVLSRRFRSDETNAHPWRLWDLDADGDLDLIVFTQGFKSGESTYLAGDGTGTFPGNRLPLVQGAIVAVVSFLVDLDLDGRTDLVTAAGSSVMGSELTFRTYLGIGGGQFSAAETFAAGEIRYQGGPSAVADVNGDGFPDFFASPYTMGGMAILGDGHGGFRGAVRLWDPDGVAAAVDLTGDGRPDLLVSGAGGRAFRRNTCGAGTAESRLVVPVVVAGGGASGASFTTEISIANHGPISGGLEVRGGDAADPGLAEARAGAQARTDGRYGFGVLGLPKNGPPSVGALRIHATGLSSPDDAGGLVRVVSTVKGSPDRGGVAFPVVRYDETFERAAVVGWLLETAADRSNLALVNVEESGDLTLRVTVVSTDPAHPGSVNLPDVTVGPGAFKQLDRVLTLGGLGATSGFARIERIAGTGRFYAYGVVNDNGTSDGSFVPALAAGTLTGETTLVVPAVVEAGSFTSEVIVTNTSSIAKRVRLEYVAEAIATADHTARVTLDVAPGQGVDLDRFVDALRTLGAPGVGPVGSIFSGALFVTAEGGGAEGLDGLYVGARTSSAAARGRYGVFTQAVPLSKAATSVAWLHGLKQDGVDRTNVALVNAGAEADVFRIEVFDGTTGLLAATVSDVRVEARGWKQLGRILAEKAPGVTNAYAKVTRVSGASPFLAYAVINDGEGPGLGTGDGSYVPMAPVLP